MKSAFWLRLSYCGIRGCRVKRIEKDKGLFIYRVTVLLYSVWLSVPLGLVTLQVVFTR